MGTSRSDRDKNGGRRTAGRDGQRDEQPDRGERDRPGPGSVGLDRSMRARDVSRPHRS